MRLHHIEMYFYQQKQLYHQLQLLNFHHYYNLSTIRKVFAIDAEALSKQWEEEYISPFFNILTNQQGQLDRLSTPRFKNGISINELRESNIDI